MKGRLLIVDDEKDILEKLKINLDEFADEVCIADNGRDALDLLEKKDFHCVVADIKMPKLDGIELLKSMRQSGDDTPFVFFTGYGSHELMMEAIKYGAFDFLDKPNIDRLEDIVKRGLQEGILRKKGTKKRRKEDMKEYKRLLDMAIKK